MVSPISRIEVFSNSSIIPSGLVSLGKFPVDNNAQRSATLRGEDYVKITFMYGKSIPIPAFAFIEYDGQIFFNKETYRPIPVGDNYYEYSVKFVSFANMLTKPQAYRHVVVDNEEWNEPDIEFNGTLEGIANLIKESIKTCSSRYEGVFASMLNKVELVSDELSVNSESKTFSFSGQKISQVLDSIANEYDIDYWFEQVGNIRDGISKVKLHFSKCERMDIDPLILSDKTARSNPFTPLRPTISLGLDECSFANEWSGVVQRITPFGAERNITRNQAIVNQMFVSYGKRLRLDYNHSCVINGKTIPHSYAIKNEEGETEALSVDEFGAVYVPGVTTGEESIEKYDDIYPRGYFRVTHVTQRGTDQPIYTVYAIPTEERNGVFVDMTDAEIDSMQEDENKRLFPIEIADGQTLSIHFSSGYLNGREFEVANKSAKMLWDGSAYKVDAEKGHWVACFEIEPTGDNNESQQVPFGSMVPRGSKDMLGYEGDIFAIFNMEMPPFYVESAQNELAQKAYDEIKSILYTRPEVKCRGNEVFFLNHDMCIGMRARVTSDLFGPDVEFISRVTNYSFYLSKPSKVDFRLCSSRVKGLLSIMKSAIADQTNSITGIEQTARSISRRAFRDAMEMKQMLETLVAEMMIVGVERNQFTFTMGIDCLETTSGAFDRKFNGLRITAGEIQHTQEPYIKDAWEGHYIVDPVTLTTDHNGNYINSAASDEFRNTPYYLYAVINNATGKAYLQLWAEKKDGEDDEQFLLLGILSSEFEDGKTSLRVFNRSNGYTQIAGGTLTTEQIQDPTRSLIIDMSSNPPRIIARNGAEIIGNIKFKASDTMTAEEQLAALGVGVDGAKAAADEAANAANEASNAAAQAKTTANAAQTAVNNVTNDGIISGGAEKSNLKRDWQAIAGENMLGTEDGSFFKAVVQAQTYSVNAVQMRDFFDMLRYAMAFILQNPNADTYISEGIPINSAGTSVINTRDNFNLLWKNYYDSEIAVLNAVSNKIKAVADAAQATADGLKWTDVAVEKDVEYTGSSQHKGLDYIPLLLSAKSGTYIPSRTGEYNERHNAINGCIVAFKKGFAATSDFENYSSNVYGIFHWGDTIVASQDIDLYACKQTYDYVFGKFDDYIDVSNEKLEQEDYEWYIYGISILTLTTNAISALDYLRAALTDGSTEIAGGLTITNVLMLKNLLGAVMAGMSGLNENVLLWGGGTYEDAYNASESDEYYKKDSTTPITTLLKKDGTGKIGIYKISDTQAIVDVPNQGKVVIDASSSNGGIFIKDTYGIDKAVITPKSLSAVSINNKKTISKSNKDNNTKVSVKSYTYSRTILTLSSEKGNHSPEFGVNVNTRITVSPGQLYKGQYNTILFSIRLYLTNSSGKTEYRDIYSTSKKITYEENEEAYDNQENLIYDFKYSSSVAFSKFSNCVLNYVLLVVEVNGNPNGNDGDYDQPECRIENVLLNNSISITDDITLLVNPHTIIANDGILSYYDSTKYFKIQNTSSGQKIYAKGLSTTKGTSGSGELYVSSSFINAFKDFLTYFKNDWVPDVRSIGSNVDKANSMISKANEVLTKISETSLLANS